jgi:NADPH:quinone reductase-like Zn-dependent oxidoreductase
MFFEYGKATEGQSVLILGGAGNVGAYAVQVARNAGRKIVTTAGSEDLEYVRGLGPILSSTIARPSLRALRNPLRT